jgi:signal peptidase I
MANEPPNPYAPSEALAHEAANETTEARRKPSRLGAIVLSLLAFPLTGAGFYVLGRQRRLAVWMAIGVSLWTLMVIAVRTRHPMLCVFVLAGMLMAQLWSIADTAFARAGQARGAARAWLVAIAIIVGSRGTARAVKHWLVEGFQMPSGSMVPTLLVGDQMFVKKGSDDVARGDVVVFEFPMDRSTDYVKRVVAVGGDTIEVTRGVVSINGAALDQTPLEGECPEQEEPGWCQLARETNAGRSYTIMRMPGRPAADFPSTTIPEGQLFVMGDNRDNSYDSRKWGAVPLDHIKGKATVIYLSKDAKARVRFSRVGRGVD